MCALKTFSSTLTATINKKGVLDIDTVKGCTMGISKYSNGCYNLCYANKLAKTYGFDFSKSIDREIIESKQLPLFKEKYLKPLVPQMKHIQNVVKKHTLSWFRIGTMGDPCHNWMLTVKICEWLGEFRIPVIVTKHWLTIPDEYLDRLARLKVIINTSISPLDSDDEREYRLNQFNRIKASNIKSVLRIVSIKPGRTKLGKRLLDIQNELFKNKPIIDNPLRIQPSDNRVKNGDILTGKYYDLNAMKYISVANKDVYLGICSECPDQCGVNL